MNKKEKQEAEEISNEVIDLCVNITNKVNSIINIQPKNKFISFEYHDRIRDEQYY